jgi:hypothetical protein
MSLPIRTLRIPSEYALFHDGIDDYTKIEPFIVYGWQEITITEWIYAYHPKMNAFYSKFSMIGDYWIDQPSTYHITYSATDYTYIKAEWTVRKPDGTPASYNYDWFAWRNQWIHIVRRFTKDREYSVWVNGEKKYSVIVPSDYKTVLEWNPDTATYPSRYKRFVLGGNTALGEWMKIAESELHIFSRALKDDEILWDYNYPYNPIRNGLVLWLPGTDEAIQPPTWYDKSGFGNNGTIYGAQKIQLIRRPARTLTATRVLASAR